MLEAGAGQKKACVRIGRLGEARVLSTNKEGGEERNWKRRRRRVRDSADGAG